MKPTSKTWLIKLKKVTNKNPHNSDSEIKTIQRAIQNFYPW